MINVSITNAKDLAYILGGFFSEDACQALLNYFDETCREEYDSEIVSPIAIRLEWEEMSAEDFEKDCKDGAFDEIDSAFPLKNGNVLVYTG